MQIVIYRMVNDRNTVSDPVHARPRGLGRHLGGSLAAGRVGMRGSVTAGGDCRRPPNLDFRFPLTYTGVYQERRRVVAWQLYEAVDVARGDRAASQVQAAKNFDLFGAPHVAVITTPTHLGLYGALVCGLYISTFLLAAQSLGLAAIPQAALAAPAPAVRDFLGVPEDRSVVCGISFGYAAANEAANTFRSSRAGLDKVVTWHE